MDPDAPPRLGWVARVRARLMPPGWRGAFGLGLAASLGLAGSFPPVGLWPLVILPVWAAVRASDPSRATRPSGLWFAIGTIPAYAWLTRWAAQGATAGYPFFVLYLAFFMGLVVWAMGRVRRRMPRSSDLLIVPAVWVGVEAVRGLVVFNGFPWLLVEHPLALAAGDGPATLAWPARFGGVWLVGVWLCVLATLIERAMLGRRPLRHLAYAGLAVFGWLFLGGFVDVWRVGGFPAARVAVVQTNVPQSIRTGWSFDDRWADWRELREMLLAAAEPDESGGRPDFIVVPETMFPGFVLQDDAAATERDREVGWFFEPDPETGRRDAMRAGTVRDELLEASRRIGDLPIVIGATRYEGFRIEEDERGMRYESDARYNSVFVVENGVVLGETYDKQHLTPFGEVMPYISNWPWLERAFLSLAARGMAFNLEAGDRSTVFDFPVRTPSRPVPGWVAPTSMRAVGPVCFEATIGSVCRGLLFGAGGRRADVMLNLTNDGWFYDAVGGRELHMLAARWRCLETATPMVRAANTGISCVIGPNGEIVGALEPFESGVLITSIPEPGGRPVAALIGDAIGWICLAGAIFGVGWSYVPMHRKGGAEQPADAADPDGSTT